MKMGNQAVLVCINDINNSYNNISLLKWESAKFATYEVCVELNPLHFAQYFWDICTFAFLYGSVYVMNIKNMLQFQFHVMDLEFLIPWA